MERLTEKITDRDTKQVLAYRTKCREDVKAIQKLGKLEDLEEQCIEENSFGLQMLLRKWKEFADDIRELYEYREQEKQGRLLRPKFLPGDYVWEMNAERNIVSEYEVASIRYGINRVFHYMWVLRDGVYSNSKGFWDKDIGKTVFLTKEEAKDALQKMNGESV